VAEPRVSSPVTGVLISTPASISQSRVLSAPIAILVEGVLGTAAAYPQRQGLYSLARKPKRRHHPYARSIAHSECIGHSETLVHLNTIAFAQFIPGNILTYRQRRIICPLDWPSAHMARNPHVIIFIPKKARINYQ
jgi:hypothetical protein